MNRSVGNLKVSTIEDHNPNAQTDKLYDPLRSIIVNPESVTQHYIKSPRAAQKTSFNDKYERLTNEQITKIKKDIFIPVDHQLVPTGHVDKIQNTKFRVVDAQEKVVGTLINRRDVEQLVKHKKDSQIVYEIGPDKLQFANGQLELLNLGRSNPNLKSQILMGNETATQYYPDTPRLKRMLSEQRLFTYEQICKWLTFRQRQQIRKTNAGNTSAKNSPNRSMQYQGQPSNSAVKVSPNSAVKMSSPHSAVKMSSPNSTVKMSSPQPAVKMSSPQTSPNKSRQYNGQVPVPMARQARAY